MSWAIDRVGRPLIDLLGKIQHLEACRIDLYLDVHQDEELIGVLLHRGLTTSFEYRGVFLVLLLLVRASFRASSILGTAYACSAVPLQNVRDV